jgi:hypothetical protein
MTDSAAALPSRPSRPAGPPGPSLRARDTDFTLAELLGDCARMAPHWAVPRSETPAPVAPSRIHGVVVPESSVRLLGGMSAYGSGCAG